MTNLGKSHGHLGSVRIKDGRGTGTTQLWLGSSTSLHDQLQLPVARESKYRSIALQRFQPLNESLGINVGVGRTRYETGSDRYRGTSVSFGLSLREPSKLFRRR